MWLVTAKLFLKWTGGRDVRAMTLWPWIILREKELSTDECLINHERIHGQQQKELLLAFFYILYFYFYLVARLRGKDHFSAYMDIPFEKEAYDNDHNFKYLENRKLMAWWRYC